MKKVISLLLIVFVFSLLTGCVEEYKRNKVDAVVIEKDYDEAKITYKTVTKNGKTTKKAVREPEEYEVTIKYKDIEKEIEDEDLYNRVEVGDTLLVIYEQGLNKEGKVITESIELK